MRRAGRSDALYLAANLVAMAFSLSILVLCLLAQVFFGAHWFCVLASCLAILMVVSAKSFYLNSIATGSPIAGILLVPTIAWTFERSSAYKYSVTAVVPVFVVMAMAKDMALAPAPTIVEERYVARRS